MIYNEDCISRMKKLKDGSIDAIITDPPYGIGANLKKRGSHWHQIRDNYFTEKGFDDKEDGDFLDEMDALFAEIARVCKARANVLVFCSWENAPKLRHIAEKNGLWYKIFGVWVKTCPMPKNMNLDFVNATEFWMRFVNMKNDNKAKTGTYNNDGKLLTNLYTCHRPEGKEVKYGRHPTQKPVKMLRYFIETLTNEYETVLDPYMGTGATGVACGRLNRHFIGCEIDENYFEIAKKRIEDENQVPLFGKLSNSREI